MQDKIEKLKGSKIVLVDDSKVAINFIASALIGLGLDVETFMDPLEALKKIEEIQPDCILTDYEMPNLSGKELIQKIRANEKTEKIPVIVLTSVDNDTKVVECLNVGATDYLLKRANPEILVARIMLVLEAQMYHQQAQEKERLETFKKTSVTLNHTINNINQRLVLLLSSLKREEEVSEKIKEHIDKLKIVLENMTDLLKKMAELDQVEFIQYVDDQEMVKLPEDNKESA